jgi:DNA-binding NarL/FixJ family response regulator
VIRVVIADDEPLVRRGIALILRAEHDIDVVGEAGDGVAVGHLVASAHPDVVVMDVRMPEVDGVEATRRLAGSRPRILMISTYNVDAAVAAALRAGAAGFVLKDAAPAELVSAVRAVHDGEGWLDPGVTRTLISEFAARPPETPPTLAALARLTPREREVLVLVAHGMTNVEIAEHLIVGASTVKTHLQRILCKLGLRGRTDAVVTAYRSGMVHPRAPLPPRSC